MQLKWNGEQLKKKMDIACKYGIEKTMENCVRESKQLVPKKTTILQGSIQMRPAEKHPGFWSGLWGSFQVMYALFVELGTAPHKIFPKDKQALFWPGADHPVKSVNHPGTKEHPFLRPSADHHYPELAGHIRDGLAAQGGST